MDKTETMLNKSVERSDLPEQQVADVTEKNDSQSYTHTAAQKDAADILAILDNFGAPQPTTEQFHEDASLTTEEQDKLFDLIGDIKPKSETENKDEQTDFLRLEITENKGDFDKIQKKTSPSEQEQNKIDDLPFETQSKFEATADHHTLSREIDGLLNKIQTQLEAVITEHDTLSRELILTRARVEALENIQPDEIAEKPNRAMGNEDVGHLRLNLTNITKWHKSLTVLVQKLLKLAENSNAERENLEADLNRAQEKTSELQNKVQSMQEELEDYDNMVTDLRTRLVDQAAMLTTTHEKLLHEVSQRRKTEQMLRIIKSRITPLTRTKSATQYISQRNI